MSITSTESELLVSTDWVDEHRSDDNVRIVESDEDLLLYQLHKQTQGTKARLREKRSVRL